MELSPESSDEILTKCLNQSAYCQDPTEQLAIFYKIQEILLRKSPHLLPQYLQNVLNFITDRSTDVKKALVGFIEELCKICEPLIPNVMVTLHMLLCDESVIVQKRVIQATITIYRRTLAWLCRASACTEDMEKAWTQLCAIKLEIANMIDSDNDGIRTSSVKFLECVVLLQTYPDETENRRQNDFSLDDVPLTLKIARRRRLEEEASNLFEVLVKFHGSPHISSANLLACIGVLTNIAKSRAAFMERVIDAIESLYNNLPPTLTTTQVSSVKKKLKTELSGLLKHPAAYEFVNKISPLLVELGCNTQEINKMIPKSDERRKYNKRTLSSESLVQQSMKKPRLTVTESEYIDEFIDPNLTPLEINEQYILENLTLEKAVYLIVTNIPKLPTAVLPDFIKDYAPFSSTGNIGKIHLASVMAKQFIEAGVGPGIKVVPKEVSSEVSIRKSSNRKRDRECEDIQSDKDHPPTKKEKTVHFAKMIKYMESLKPMDLDIKERILIDTVKRVLKPHQSTNKQLHQKIITMMATSFNMSVRDAILSFLVADLRTHVDIALAWLFEEYSIMQGFTRLPPIRRGGKLSDSYNLLLCTFINISSSDVLILSRLLLEAPLITDEALNEVRVACRDERRSGWALGLIRDLAIRKPPKQVAFLNVLLSFTTYDSAAVRGYAVNYVLELFKSHTTMRPLIEEFARMHLEFLKLPSPPESLSGPVQGRLKSETWGDDFVVACLTPYTTLMQEEEKLIHDLVTVYVQANADIKKVMLRMIEKPVRGMGMDSVELLKLVEECPKGSETLVTRIIHILTDKGPPSVLLVERVRDLYHTRISDIRFLIPVLNGLKKQEIIAALPKLIKLNPVVVREVFNRLLGLHGDSPITASELLVALHLIDQNKVDLKTIIKATSMCLQEKQVYTQEVLAVVLQQLMEQPTIPTLLMRTVIQALGSYPRLSGFVMNILQRLILKKVWKQKVVWEGFIKCCQRTKPQSFAVLMQLPAPQLYEALNICPDLQLLLREHLLSFTETQRAHVPQAIQEVILGNFVSPEIPGSEHDVAIVEDNSFHQTAPQPEPLPPGME